MTEREPGINSEQRTQIVNDFVEGVFGDQPYLYGGASPLSTLTARRVKHNIPVGEPNFEDYGVEFQPHLYVEEYRTYPRTARPNLVHRTLGRLLMPEQERLRSWAESTEPDSQSIEITYTARRLTAGQVSGHYDGLRLLFSNLSTSPSQPLFHTYLLYDDSMRNPKAAAQRIEKYKTELTGLDHPTDEQLIDSIKKLAAVDATEQ